MLELVGIIGATIIGVATLIFNAWLYRRDESLGPIMLLVNLAILLIVLAVITDLSS